MNQFKLSLILVAVLIVRFSNAAFLEIRPSSYQCSHDATPEKLQKKYRNVWQSNYVRNPYDVNEWIEYKFPKAVNITHIYLREDFTDDAAGAENVSIELSNGKEYFFLFDKNTMVIPIEGKEVTSIKISVNSTYRVNKIQFDEIQFLQSFQPAKELIDLVDNHDIKDLKKALKKQLKAGYDVSNYVTANYERLLKHAFLTQNIEAVNLLLEYGINHETTELRDFEILRYRSDHYENLRKTNSVYEEKLQSLQSKEKIKADEFIHDFLTYSVSLQRKGTGNIIRAFGFYLPKHQFDNYLLLVRKKALQAIEYNIKTRIRDSAAFKKLFPNAIPGQVPTGQYYDQGIEKAIAYNYLISRKYSYYCSMKEIYFNTRCHFSYVEAFAEKLENGIRIGLAEMPDLETRSENIKLWKILEACQKNTLQKKLLAEIKNALPDVKQYLSKKEGYVNQLQYLKEVYSEYKLFNHLPSVDSMCSWVEQKFYAIVSLNKDDIWEKALEAEVTDGNLSYHYLLTNIKEEELSFLEDEYIPDTTTNYPNDLHKYIYNWRRGIADAAKERHRLEIQKQRQARIDTFYMKEEERHSFAEKNGYAFIDEAFWVEITPILAYGENLNGYDHVKWLKTIFYGDWDEQEVPSWPFKLLFNSFVVKNSALYGNQLPKNSPVKTFTTTHTTLDGYNNIVSQYDDVREIKVHPRLANIYNSYTTGNHEVGNTGSRYRYFPPKILESWLRKYGPSTRAYEQLFENFARYANGQPSLQQSLTPLKNTTIKKNPPYKIDETDRTLKFACLESMAFPSGTYYFNYCSCIEENVAPRLSNEEYSKYANNWSSFIDDKRNTIPGNCYQSTTNPLKFFVDLVDYLK